MSGMEEDDEQATKESHRRPMGYYKVYNDWFQAEYARNQKKPTVAQVTRWYEDHVHELELPSPSLKELKRHSKGLRPIHIAKAYSASYYRRRLGQDKPGQVSGRSNSIDSEGLTHHQHTPASPALGPSSSGRATDDVSLSQQGGNAQQRPYQRIKGEPTDSQARMIVEDGSEADASRKVSRLPPLVLSAGPSSSCAPSASGGSGSGPALLLSLAQPSSSRPGLLSSLQKTGCGSVMLLEQASDARARQVAGDMQGPCAHEAAEAGALYMPLAHARDGYGMLRMPAHASANEMHADMLTIDQLDFPWEALGMDTSPFSGPGMPVQMDMRCVPTYASAPLPSQLADLPGGAMSGGMLAHALALQHGQQSAGPDGQHQGLNGMPLCFSDLGMSAGHFRDLQAASQQQQQQQQQHHMRLLSALHHHQQQQDHHQQQQQAQMRAQGGSGLERSPPGRGSVNCTVLGSSGMGMGLSASLHDPTLPPLLEGEPPPHEEDDEEMQVGPLLLEDGFEFQPHVPNTFGQLTHGSQASGTGPGAFSMGPQPSLPQAPGMVSGEGDGSNRLLASVGGGGGGGAPAGHASSSCLYGSGSNRDECLLQAQLAMQSRVLHVQAQELARLHAHMQQAQAAQQQQPGVMPSPHSSRPQSTHSLQEMHAAEAAHRQQQQRANLFARASALGLQPCDLGMSLGGQASAGGLMSDVFLMRPESEADARMLAELSRIYEHSPRPGAFLAHGIAPMPPNAASLPPIDGPDSQVQGQAQQDFIVAVASCQGQQARQQHQQQQQQQHGGALYGLGALPPGLPCEAGLDVMQAGPDLMEYAMLEDALCSGNTRHSAHSLHSPQQQQQQWQQGQHMLPNMAGGSGSRQQATQPLPSMSAFHTALHSFNGGVICGGGGDARQAMSGAHGVHVHGHGENGGSTPGNGVVCMDDGSGRGSMTDMSGQHAQAMLGQQLQLQGLQHLHLYGSGSGEAYRWQ